VSISEDRTVRIWDLANGTELAALSGHERMIYALALTPEGRCAITGGADLRLRVWDLEERRELRTLAGHPDGIYGIQAVTAMPNGAEVVSVCDDGSLLVWDLASGDVINAFRADSALYECVTSPDGSILVAGDRSGQVHILEWMPD